MGGNERGEGDVVGESIALGWHGAEGAAGVCAAVSGFG